MKDVSSSVLHLSSLLLLMTTVGLQYLCLPVSSSLQNSKSNEGRRNLHRLQFRHLQATEVAFIATSPENGVSNRSSTLNSSSLFDVNTLEHAPPPRAHVGRKTVLVTGGAGFVGSHVADYLLGRGDRVIVLDEVNDYYDVNIKESNLQLLLNKGGSQVLIYRGNICNTTLVQHIFETEKPKWVVHLAARAGVRPSIIDPFVYIYSNIQGTTRLLEMAVQYKVINFVMASTSSVYGGSRSTLFDEDENVDFPISPYAASKRVTEFMGSYYHATFGLPITALRFFTVYGPRGRPDMAPFKFIDRMARGKPIQQFGDGSSSRDYTYIDDIVSGVVGALDRPTPIYQNVNLGKGSGTSLSQFVALVAKYVGKQPEIIVLPDQPGDVPYTCANVTRAHIMLNYTPTIPFETGIAKTVEWYKQVYPYSLAENTTERKVEQGNIKDHSDTENVIHAEHHGEKYRHRRRLQIVPPHEGRKKVMVVAQQWSTLLTQHVVNTLASRGDSVTVIVPTSCIHPALLEPPKEYEFDPNQNVSIHYGCVDNATFLENVWEQEKPEWVCYLNSLSNAKASRQDPYTFIDVNIQALVRVLEVARRHEISNFVYTSSTDVYPQSAVWHSETETIPQFDSPYAVTQKAREVFAHTWHSLYHIPMTGLRIPQIYGPSQDWFVMKTSHGYTSIDNDNDEDQSQVQEFMFVTDAVDGIVRALDRPYPYQIFNLGQGPDWVEEACQAQSSLKEMVLAQLQGKFFATSLIQPCALVTVRKAQELLGFSAQVRLREGIRRVAVYLWEHPNFLPNQSDIMLAKPGELGGSQSSYPPLPWGSSQVDVVGRRTAKRNEKNTFRLPVGMEALAEMQWVVVAAVVLWKFLSWGRRCNI